MNNLLTFFIEEPNLIFSERAECTEPQGGLYLYGPSGRYADNKPNPIISDVGIVGTSKSIGATQTFFEYIHRVIPSESVGRLDFPGLGINNKLLFDIKFDEQWIEIINDKEIQQGNEMDDRLKRIDYFLDLIDKKMLNIKKKGEPDLIIFSLPEEIIQLCKNPEHKGDNIIITDRRFKKELTQEQIKGDFDFHSIIKLFGMKHNIPTQFIKPKTLDVYRKIGVQDLATRAWNLSVAMYYKSKGYPWKIAKLDPFTCYAGISFYREVDKDKHSMRASVAHLFLHTGECIVLTGEPFEWDDPSVEPILTTEQTIILKKKIIKGYEEIHGELPKRLVIYKKTDFTEDEIIGFKENEDKSINEIDLLTVKYSNIKWFREGDYPPPRGTVIKCPNNEFLLFTLGFIQDMNTYPQAGIPSPLRIIAYNLDSDERKMCREILSLSKLNWNNINYCELFPGPIAVSGIIGKILSEGRSKKIPIKTEFRFYM